MTGCGSDIIASLVVGPFMANRPLAVKYNAALRGQFTPPTKPFSRSGSFRWTGWGRASLVVNRCIEDDLNAKQLEEKWTGDLTGGVVRIARNDGVERIARNYHFGSLASQPQFWQHT